MLDGRRDRLVEHLPVGGQHESLEHLDRRRCGGIQPGYAAQFGRPGQLTGRHIELEAAHFGDVLRLGQPPLTRFQFARRGHLDADVTHDRREPYDATHRVAGRRGRDVDVDEAAVLAPTSGPEALGRAAGDQPLPHPVPLLHLVGRQQHVDRGADHLVLVVAEQPLRGGVPAVDDAVTVGTEDGVAGLLDDRRQLPLRLLGVAPVGDVEHDEPDADDLTVDTYRVVVRAPVPDHGGVGVGGPADVDPEHGLAGGQHAGIHRFEPRPQVGDEVGHPAELAAHRRFPHLGERVVDEHLPEVAVDEGQPDGRAGDQRLEQRRSPFRVGVRARRRVVDRHGGDRLSRRQCGGYPFTPV